MRTTTRPVRVTRVLPVALTLAAASLLAACGGSAATTPPPVDPTPVIIPTPVGGSEGPGVVVVARDIEFQPDTIAVPADAPFTLVLDNRDDAIPHGIEVMDAEGTSMIRSEIVAGPTRLPIAMPALTPGVYPFTCPVHPNMTGVLIAQP